MKRSGTYWRRSAKACGATLVEAVVGTALLGTLLVSMLLAGGRIEAQSARASRRIAACRTADRLLESWWSDRTKFPRDDSGDVQGGEGLRWRTHRIENESAEEWGAEVVALEIVSANAGGEEEEILATVEVMLPVENLENEDEKADGNDAD